jgi:Uma2 family endonuclease
LQNGDRLARDDFERRYHAMPHVKKAELIEGRVYMPSPTHADAHGRPHSILAGWLLFYEAYTDYVYAYDNATVRLDLDNEVQPDVLLRIDEAAGGQSRISDDDYVEGAPELVVEVAHSSAAYDLHDKKTAYRRNGVREYVVWQIEENRLDWFALDGTAYTTREAEDGMMESRVFPGLVLDVGALLERDVAAVLDAVREGVGGAAHGEFVEGLEEERQRS